MTNQHDLTEGGEYSKGQLEQIFQIRFGYQINGIVVRKIEARSESRLILLFQRTGGPYPDLVTDGEIRYVGAGLRGDQSLSGLNRVLAERGPIDGVHFFQQSHSVAKWRYLGHGPAHLIGEDFASGRRLLMYDVQLD